MTDQECEAHAIWQLRKSGCRVRRTTHYWSLVDRYSGVCMQIGTLAALVTLADARYARLCPQQPIAPTA